MIEGDKIRICWPNPDATCLEGGCGYCRVKRPRSLASVEKWAETAGQVRDRNGGKTQDAASALRYQTTGRH